MIALLIGILTLVQPQSPMPDTLSQVQVLHDSLTTQDGEVLSLSSLTGWEFTTDNIEDPTASVHWVKLEEPISNSDAFPDSLWNGFGYYRLAFKVDSSFSLNKSFLRLTSGLNVAAEVFLNDELVIEVGTPSRDKDKEEIVGNYIGLGQPVTLVADTEYVLIVKRSYHRFPLYNTLTFGISNGPSWFSINIASLSAVSSTVEDAKSFTFLLTLVCIVIFLLCILYLFLYFKVKDQNENLWLVLLMISIGCVALNGLMFQFTIHHFWVTLVMYSLSSVFGALALTLVPLVTHKLLKVKAHTFWKAYVVVGTVLYAISFSANIYVYIFVLVLILSLSGGLIAIYKAYKQGVRDTLIPAVSILGLPATLVTFQILDSFGITVGASTIPMLFLFLTLPVGLSLYQGRKFLRLHLEMDGLVEERTNELEEAYVQLENSLKELQATQHQLIQQEKLASLGQLTAGIAHEIKNPLNFVNNFSELSVELIEEAREELSAFSRQRSAGRSDEIDQENSPLEGGGSSSSDEEPGNVRKVEEALEILDDIEANLRKIHEHGSRADSIVKSMLEHSRGGSGQKEPTDLNALVKEFTNLSFHGMRASKNPINVDMEFEFDEDIGEVPLVAEDFSRVIVNLCNNAFDAMREKMTINDRRLSDDSVGAIHELPLQNADYKPKLTIRTKSEGNVINLEIEDNGPGIPEEMKDKILQPFFTTKKGTEGTGLGLSITNDIIKAHGGQMDVHSQPGQTVFTIKLTA